MTDKFTSFGAWCSGASLDVLNYCTDDVALKYSAIGYSTLLNGLTAGMAYGYVILIIFNSNFFAILFGIIGFICVFSILKATISLSFRHSYFLGQKDRFASLLFTAIPRLLITILVALTIAFSLQIKIFEHEINSEIKLNIGKYSTSTENDKTEPSRSIVARTLALNKLQNKNSTISVISNMFTILIVLIEIFPILVFLFSSEDQYVAAIRELEHKSHKALIEHIQKKITTQESIQAKKNLNNKKSLG